MIKFEKFQLDNGLKVIVHEDVSTPMAVVNILYNVGSRDEHPDKTGFAHLFEHLMFGGSANIETFDKPLQKAGGINNAYTNSDITNYYDVLPANNIETAFWLESDRMYSLNFNKRNLDNQTSVVCEEFKEMYLNQPYGDVWLKLRPLAYKMHPYKWGTIGKELSHIQNATLDDVKDFFFKYYRPNNAIMTVAGNIKFKTIKDLANKWFGNIEPGHIPARNLPKEPFQKEPRHQKVEANVPVDAIYKVYHMCTRNDRLYHIHDLITDILASGKSSRLYKELVKNQKLLSQVNAYVSGNIDEGLLVIEGKLVKGISMQRVERAIEKEIGKLQSETIPDDELEKVKNKAESALLFSETSVLHKAEDLAFYELLEDASLINREIKKYTDVAAGKILEQASKVLDPNNCSTIWYLSKK